MAKPVMITICPVKPMYGHGHHTAFQFQGVGNVRVELADFA